MASDVNFLPGSLLARAPDGSRVLLRAGLVKDLRARAIEAFLSLPRRGVEIGGVLYGQLRGGERRIETFEEAPCEHRYGPSYALSENDRAQLREMLAQHQDEGGSEIAGFFRSFTSREPLIEAADEEFVAQNFPAGNFLYLLLQPLSPQVCKAELRLFRNGELLREMESPAFDFDPERMETVTTPASAPQTAATPLEPPPPPQPQPAECPLAAPLMPAAEEQPRVPVVPHLPPSYRSRIQTQRPGREPEPAASTLESAAVERYTVREKPVPDPRPRTRRWMPVAICLLAGLLGAAVYELWILGRQPRWTELHLDAKQTDGQLEVTWDAAAARATGATRALLAVSDGDSHRDLELSQDQMRSGRYVYRPSHGNVAFRMILYAKGLGVSGDAVHIAPVPGLALTPAVPPAPSANLPDAERAAPAPETAAPASAHLERPVVPPLTVHEVQPFVPEGIRSRIEGQIVIPVEVEVSSRGRVIRATTQASGADGLHRYLADLAEKAARGWRFTPAKSRRGVPMASAKTLNFVFAP